MQVSVPAVVVPGFCGYALEADELAEELTPSRLLESLVLSFLEGREDRPGSYVVALPEQPVLAPEPPPEPALEALARALPDHGAKERLFHFIYDWRRDLTQSAAALSSELSSPALGESELDLIGVGPGSLLVRHILTAPAFSRVAGRVRYVVSIGHPGGGIPALLLLLGGVCSVFGAEAALADVEAAFPAAFQLLPPRGSGAVTRHGAPGLRVDVFQGPALEVGGSGTILDKRLLARLRERSEAIHGLAMPSAGPLVWRAAAFAGSGLPTYCELALGEQDGAPAWIGLERHPTGGDGLVPLVGAVAHAGVRCFLATSPHRDLAADRAVTTRLAALLGGPHA